MDYRGNSNTEHLARCGHCDYIAYESIVKNHVRLVHETKTTQEEDIIEKDNEPETIEEDNNSEPETFEEESSSNHHWTDKQIKSLMSLYENYKADFEGKKFTNKNI